MKFKLYLFIRLCVLVSGWFVKGCFLVLFVKLGFYLEGVFFVNLYNGVMLVGVILVGIVWVGGGFIYISRYFSEM